MQPLNRNFILILLTSFLFSILSCEKVNQEISDTFSISYKLDNGFSDYRYYIDINHSGKMKVYFRYGLDNILREEVYQINNSELAELKDKLVTLSTIELEDVYLPDEDVDIPTDVPIRTYQYDFNSLSDSTQLHFMEGIDLPEELNSLIEVMEGIIEEYDGM